MTAPAALPVLMFHGLHTGRNSSGHFDLTYSVDPATFGRQLDWLVENGFTSVLLSGHGEATRPVVVTFDDGDVSDIDVAVPMLLERGLVAEFFVTSDHVGQPGRLTPADVAVLAGSGMGVQSHGRTHRCLADLSPAELDDELRTSKGALEGWTGVPVEALSLPGGRGGTRERQAARAMGYRYLLNSVPGPNRDRRSAHYLHRLTVTRGTTLDEFSMLVEWSGPAARRAMVRTAVLEVGKRALGNSRYEFLRSRIRRS